jgi:energy-converting hydrogenase Eha subunit C
MRNAANGHDQASPKLEGTAVQETTVSDERDVAQDSTSGPSQGDASESSPSQWVCHLAKHRISVGFMFTCALFEKHSMFTSIGPPYRPVMPPRMFALLDDSVLGRLISAMYVQCATIGSLLTVIDACGALLACARVSHVSVQARSESGTRLVALPADGRHARTAERRASLRSGFSAARLGRSIGTARDTCGRQTSAFGAETCTDVDLLLPGLPSAQHGALHRWRVIA